jgi:putative tricarboxylic transport membrane protein
MLVPVFIILLSVVWFIASVMLPKAPLGDPNGPMYYPLVLSAFLFIMGIIYFIQEWKIRHKDKGILKALLSGRTPKLLIITIVLCLLYSAVFETLGFLVSTIVFMALLLFIINGFRGWKKWVANITVSVLFSFIMWYGFSQLLSISLP